jgi:hypothetical protein
LNDDLLLKRTESWFVKRGLPYFIEDRKATDDVFTRALPLLLGLFVINLMVVLSLHLMVWQRIGGAVLGVALMALLYMVLNLVRGQKALRMPTRIGWIEIAGFVLIPPIVAFAARHEARDALIDLAVSVGVALVIYLLASALVPLARWAARRAFQEIGEVFTLAARALPLLFLFNSFLFISKDVWEFSGDMSRTRIWGVVGLFAVFTVLFLFYQLPEEVRRVAAHDDRSTVVEACVSTPMETVAARVVLHEGALPLSRSQRINMLLVLFIGQIVQVLLLGVLVFLFFLGFGKAALSQELINNWTGEPKEFTKTAKVFGHALQYHDFSIDDRLWQVSLFLAAVSAFFFAISSLTDDAYKAQFYERMNKELEMAIQVRRVYLALYEGRHAVSVELSATGSHVLHTPKVPIMREAEAAVQQVVEEAVEAVLHRDHSSPEHLRQHTHTGVPTESTD